MEAIISSRNQLPLAVSFNRVRDKIGTLYIYWCKFTEHLKSYMRLIANWNFEDESERLVPFGLTLRRLTQIKIPDFVSREALYEYRSFIPWKYSKIFN